jgi:hypothetical protein
MTNQPNREEILGRRLEVRPAPLTPVQAAGVRATIQAFGDAHDSAKILSQFLAESGVEPEFGEYDAMVVGVGIGIEVCKKHCVPYVNVKNLTHVLDTDARVNDIGRRED